MSMQSVLTFDGQDDYIETTLDAQPSALPATTWEAWVKPTRNRSDWDFILSTDDGGWDRMVGLQSGRFSISHGTGAWDAVAADMNQWQHIAVVYTADNKIKFYKNGTEYVYTGNVTIGATKQHLYIGCLPNKNYFFQGSLAEVSIWNYVRTPDEIKQNMNSRLNGNESGLVGYWPLNEGSGNIANDKTSTNNNVTIEGATWESADIPITEPESEGTGLQDYGYWYRWAHNLPQPTDSKPFRRGRIWA